MLARLNQINGVQGSYSNGSGTLLLLDLGPNADPGTVARESRRVLTEQAGDRVPERLERGEAAEVLRVEEWQGNGPVAADSATEARASGATEVRTTVRRATALLAVLLLGCAAVGLALFWWLSRRGRAGEEDVGRVSPASH